VSFYEYKLLDGVMADLATDRIYFGRSGVVVWIEAIVPNRDGQIHTIREIADQLGTTLDQVYRNNDLRGPLQYDVHAGPDDIYVWAECGLVVSAVSSSTDRQASTPGLMVRHPVSADDYLLPTPSIDAVVIFKFFFPPTCFAGFDELYRDKVPYCLIDTWEEYLERSKQ